MKNTSTQNAVAEILNRLVGALPGYILGAAVLTLLSVPAALNAKASISYGVTFIIWFLPALIGLIEAAFLSRVVSQSYLDIFSRLQACWYLSPLLLLNYLPVPATAQILPVFASYIFAVGLLAVPVIAFRQSIDECKRDSFYLTMFIRAFVLATFLLLQRCIYHDALWNYGYLRSVVIDGDLDMYNEFILHNSYFMYVPHPNEPIFFMGSALFMAPFFILAHILVVLFQPLLQVTADGYSWPYTLITGFAGVFASLAGCIMTYRLLRRLFCPLVSFITLSLIFFAGNMVFYAFTWPLYTHPFSVMMISAFVLFWISTRAQRTHSQWFVWGLILGLAAWIRPQTVLFGLLPAWDLASDFFRRKKIPLSIIASASLFGLAVVLGFAPQMVIWARTEGSPLIDVYAHIGDDFSWTHPRMIYLLFAARQGFLTWHPLFIACIPGFYLLWRRDRSLAIPLGACFALQAYIISCYEFPEGGAGFGSRYLLATTPFLAICIAETVAALRRSPRLLPLITSLAILAVFSNLLLLITYHTQLLPHNAAMPPIPIMLKQIFITGPAHFWQYFNSTDINENVFARPFASSIVVNDTMALIKVMAGMLAVLLLTAGSCAILRRTPSRRATAVIAAGLILPACLVMLVILTRRSFESVYSVLRLSYDRQEAMPALPIRELKLTEDEPSRVIDIKHRQFSDRLDIVYTVDGTAGSDAIPPFTVELTLDGQLTSQPGPTNPPSPVRHWLRASHNRYTYGHGFVASYGIPSSAPVTGITFRVIDIHDTVIINGVYLNRSSSEDTALRREPLVQVIKNE